MKLISILPRFKSISHGNLTEHRLGSFSITVGHSLTSLSLGVLCYICVMLLLYFLQETLPLHTLLTLIFGLTISFIGALVIAVSDPGIVENSPEDIENSGPDCCQLCSASKGPLVQHCLSCGTCIRDIDHHCMFFGKCIARKNIWLFRGVAGLTATTLLSAYVQGFELMKSTM